MSWIEAARDHIGDVKTAGEMAWADTWISSGNYGLNWAISNRFQRGYPAGHAVELFGEPGTGKTLLVARAIASVQEMGGRAFLEDSEGGFNPSWAARALGVDPEGLLMFSSDPEDDDFGTVKQHKEHLSDFISFVEDAQEVPYVLALDSLGGLTTVREINQDFESTDVGHKAKMLHKLFRLVKSRMKTLPVVYLVTNHVYESPNPYGKSQKASGGKALKFHASVRIALKGAKKVDDGPEEGNIISGWIEKNRCGPDQREFEFFLPEERAISPYSGLIPALETAGITAMTSGYRVAYDPDIHPKKLAAEGLPEEKDALKDLSTGIRAQKTSPVKRERSAKHLLEEYPKLLDHADATLAAREEMVREAAP